MIECPCLVFFRDENDRCRIFVVRHAYRYQLHLPVAPVRETAFRHAASMVSPFGRARCHLRMIHGLLHVEHQNVLMLAQRHPVGIEMARNTVLLPYEVITPDSRLGKHEMRGEYSLGEQDYRTVRLDNPTVLLPQRTEGYLPVPTC